MQALQVLAAPLHEGLPCRSRLVGRRLVVELPGRRRNTYQPAIGWLEVLCACPQVPTLAGSPALRTAMDLADSSSCG